MTDKLQKKAFIDFEGDAWYTRNKSYIDSYDGSKDPVCQLLKKYKIEEGNILEIGCSAGYRINYLKQQNPVSHLYGIDPSLNAVNYGKTKYNNIELSIGTADDISQYQDNFFDTIIVGFVFYVIDRPILFKSIAEIDRLLKNKGNVIIMDFFLSKAN